jgi:hypothetical protein
MLLQLADKTQFVYVIQSKLSDGETDKVPKKLRLGSQHTCRITSYNHVDG